MDDDVQDGGDHVDSNRSTAYGAGAYVNQGKVVSTQYNTIDFIRAMEEVLGLPPLSLNDALAHPMTDTFNTVPGAWRFTAAPSALLYNTPLPLPPKPAGVIVPKPKHNPKYWARVTKAMDFTDADRLDPAEFNRILWKRMMGNKPYTAGPAMPKDGERGTVLARCSTEVSLVKTIAMPVNGLCTYSLGWRSSKLPPRTLRMGRPRRPSHRSKPRLAGRL